MSSTIGVCILANVLIILSSIFSFGCINSALPLPALANCFIKYEFTFESMPNGNILLFFPCSFTKSIICFSFPTWPSVNSSITFSVFSYSANFIGFSISVPPAACKLLIYLSASCIFFSLYSIACALITSNSWSNAIMLNLSPSSNCFKHSITALLVSSNLTPIIDPDISIKNKYSFSLSSYTSSISGMNDRYNMSLPSLVFDIIAFDDNSFFNFISSLKSFDKS